MKNIPIARAVMVLDFMYSLTLGPFNDNHTILSSLVMCHFAVRIVLIDSLTSFTWLSSLKGRLTRTVLSVSFLLILTWMSWSHCWLRPSVMSCFVFSQSERFSILISIPPVNSIDGLKFIKKRTIDPIPRRVDIITQRKDLLMIENGPVTFMIIIIR